MSGPESSKAPVAMSTTSLASRFGSRGRLLERSGIRRPWHEPPGCATGTDHARGPSVHGNVAFSGAFGQAPAQAPGGFQTRALPVEPIACLTHKICAINGVMTSEKRTNYAFSPAQCRAARALLGWSRERLSEASGVSMRALSDFELMTTTPRVETIEKLYTALSNAGIAFIPEDGGGAGLRFLTPTT